METTPDAWVFKTNLDDLLSEIESGRTSPDIFHSRSNSVTTEGMSSNNSHLSSQPALAYSSSAAMIPSPSILPDPSPSEAGISPSQNGVVRDSPRSRTPREQIGRRSQHFLLSSHFPSTSSESPVSVSTPRDHGMSNHFAESYSPIQRNQIGDESSRERLSTTSVFHRGQFLPERSLLSSNNVSTNQITNPDSNNSVLARLADQASEMLRHQKRQNSMSRTITTTSSIASVSSSGTPIVSTSCIHQTTDPSAPRSTKCNNSTGHHHESSIANLQACSYSILDLQSEYLALTSQMEIQTPRENPETEGSSLASKFPSLNSSQNAHSPHTAVEESGVARSRLELSTPCTEILTRPNDPVGVKGATSYSGIHHSEVQHVGSNATENLESKDEQKELMLGTNNNFCNDMRAEQGDHRVEFSNDDLPITDRAIAHDFKVWMKALSFKSGHFYFM